MTQAPTPGPLTSESVKMLVKGDLLRCINPHTVAVKEGEVRIFERRTHNEPGAGNDIVLSDSHLGTWSGIFAFIGRPDADGWMPWSGGENPVPGQRVYFKNRWNEDKSSNSSTTALISDSLTWTHAEQDHRKGRLDGLDIIAFRLAPTAPVEASGSERDEIARLIWQRFAPSSDMDEANALRGEYVLVADDIMKLRPQPSGETRKLLERAAAIADDVERGKRPKLEAVDMIRELRNALLSARPLALGGQHSGGDYIRPNPKGDGWIRSQTTPARAEAQVDGAATRGWDREICTGCSSSLSLSDIKEGGFVSCCPDRRMVKVSDLVDAFEASRRAHPSPTPAADADRVRIAELEAEIAEMIAERSRRSVAWQRSEARADRAEALAAAPASPLPGGGWQDISTAPKDGTLVLTWGYLHDDGGPYDADGRSFTGETPSVQISGMTEFGWSCPLLGGHHPTHWMPLPAAPTGEPK